MRRALQLVPQNFAYTTKEDMERVRAQVLSLPIGRESRDNPSYEEELQEVNRKGLGFGVEMTLQRDTK